MAGFCSQGAFHLLTAVLLHTPFVPLTPQTVLLLSNVHPIAPPSLLYQFSYLSLLEHMTMQFEPPLGNTFEACRKATDDVVQWIASTARATGTVEHLFEDDIPIARRSFLQKLKVKRAAPVSLISKIKGRKRNQTKSTANATSPSTVELSYKTLSKLGKAIARADNIEVDYNVLVVLKGIIHARKGFAT